MKAQASGGALGSGCGSGPGFGGAASAGGLGFGGLAAMDPADLAELASWWRPRLDSAERRYLRCRKQQMDEALLQVSCCCCQLAGGHAAADASGSYNNLILVFICIQWCVPNQPAPVAAAAAARPVSRMAKRRVTTPSAAQSSTPAACCLARLWVTRRGRPLLLTGQQLAHLQALQRRLLLVQRLQQTTMGRVATLWMLVLAELRDVRLLCG